MKTHYSAIELLSFSLACLPNSVQGINYQARKNNWQSRKRVGKGGGKEYALASLPQEIQTEIRTKFVVSIIKAKPKSLPADLRQVELKTLTEKQREVAGARIKHGGISSDLMRLVETANNKKGKNRTLSDRTLNQWVLDYEKADTPEERLKALAPMQRVAKKAEEIVWLPDELHDLYATSLPFKVISPLSETVTLAKS